MAIEYAKVLKELSVDFTTIGRGDKSSNSFFATTGVRATTGGLDDFLRTMPPLPEGAIVAVGIEALSDTTIKLLNYGVSLILLEKPGVAYADEITSLVALTRKKNAQVLIAYNRRFYSSVRKARELIAADGGATSFVFEFTEWSHVVRTLAKHPAEHNNWFLGNSSHVIDTAFFLGGKPTEMSHYVKGGLDWHPASSIFAGAGVTDSGALFSYHANWEAPGRWVLEMLTKKHRFIFKPMEKLQVQDLGSVAVNFVEMDDSLDVNFKPGLYLLTKSFLEGDFKDFCDVNEQNDMMKFYKGISNY